MGPPQALLSGSAQPPHALNGLSRVDPAPRSEAVYYKTAQGTQSEPAPSQGVNVAKQVVITPPPRLTQQVIDRLRQSVASSPGKVREEPPQR